MKTLKKLLFLIGFILMFSHIGCEKIPTQECYECMETVETRLSDSYPEWHTTTISTEVFLNNILCDISLEDINKYEVSNTYSVVISKTIVGGQTIRFTKEWHTVKCKLQQ